MNSKPSAAFQVASKGYDQDSGVLIIKLVDGDEFAVTNAGHARTILDRIGDRGEVSAELRHWLQRYAVGTSLSDKSRLLARLGLLRVELKSKR